MTTPFALSVHGLNPRLQRMTVQQAVVCGWIVDAHRKGRVISLKNLMNYSGMTRMTLDAVVQTLVDKGFVEKTARQVLKVGAPSHVLLATPKLLHWFTTPGKPRDDAHPVERPPRP